MAEVYEALDERLARPVAVKLLLPELAAQVGMRDRFEAEARSAARLSHPSVVAVFDSGEHQGTPFIVMERLPGETLADRVSGGPLELPWLRAMAQDVLAALGAAHAAGVVHRDVKPANILVAADGRAKVADFGIAKALDAAPSDLTGANQLLGTPAYLAPERLDGLPATSRSDLYAFGVVLYEALAGVRAFPGSTPLSVAHAVQHAELVPLGQLRPDLPVHLVAVVERAMDRDPERRFRTATEMAAALAAGPEADHDPTTVGTAPTTSPATVVMPVAAVAPTGPAAGPLEGSVPRWPRGLLHGGLVAGLGRRRMTTLVLLIVALAVIAVAALLVRGGDAGGPPRSDGTPTTTAPAQAPPTTLQANTTVPAPTVVATSVPPSKGKGKGGSKG